MGLLALNWLCPRCFKANMYVKNSRSAIVTGRPAVYRRRRCINCGYSIDTFEREDKRAKAKQIRPGITAGTFKRRQNREPDPGGEGGVELFTGSAGRTD